MKVLTEKLGTKIKSEQGEIYTSEAISTFDYKNDIKSGIKAISDILNKEKDHVVISAVEHPAIAATFEFLKKCGVRVSRVPVNENGLLDPNDLRKLIDDKTALVSIMWANNETGTIFPIKECAAIAHEHGDMQNFDPKAGKHLVITMEQLGEKGNVSVGEVVAVETNYGVAFFPNLKGLAGGAHGFVAAAARVSNRTGAGGRRA